MKNLTKGLAAASLTLSLVQTGAAADPGASQPIRMQQLDSAASIVRDTNHIAHIEARNEHDVFFLQGWVHAEDRLFQMDYERRVASGTVAELLGAAALETDVTLRTLGLRRAAQQSLPALLPDTRLALQAYADGVNAWANSHALPPEYSALELTKFEPWTPDDSLAIGKLLAFSLSFELDIDSTRHYLSYVHAGSALGFDGNKLYHEDLIRSAPFDPASTVPDASRQRAEAIARAASQATRADASWIHPKAVEQAEAYIERAHRIPVLRGILERHQRAGSNLWAVGGALTDTGHPLIANDPHLDLVTPSQFYPIGLDVPDVLTVFGESLAGVPGVIQGYNKHISWGSTNLLIDVTDTYQEQVVPDVGSPSGLATLYKGRPEPVIPIPETFRVNQPGNGIPDDIVVVPPGGAIPAFTLIVPRRNSGPIISLDQATGIALSVQYTGSGATREQDAVLKFDHASNLAEFLDAVQYFGVGAQNFVYADSDGNIAYSTSGALPIREDLQANTVNGAPPWFIRNGQGGNEWLPVQHAQPHQVLPFEILPFSEMPRIVNPPAEFFVNANNDPAGVTLDNNPLGRQRAGGGIYYLAYSFNPGFRAGRIKERIEQVLESDEGRMSFAKMQSIQADVTLRDAQAFVPYILDAFRNAERAGAPPSLAALTGNARLAEAVRRLSKWSLSTPTGIAEGYDASGQNGQRSPPTQSQIDDSVGATIYAVWRSEFIKRTIDAQLTPFGLPVPDDFSALGALRNLLDNFAQNRGVGASGVNFFNLPELGVPEDARDFVLLSSLASALDALASTAFDAAFHQSTTISDYRWGKLHRLVLAHPLDGPFSIPPAGGAFPAPLAGLPGIPVDGGFQTVDAASHGVRAEGANQFMFTAGPARRFVSEPSSSEPHSESIWPGGTSGVLGSPWYLNFLPLWLTNDAIPLLLDHEEVRRQAAEVIRFVPAR
jgi:penicillin G amidase